MDVDALRSRLYVLQMHITHTLNRRVRYAYAHASRMVSRVRVYCGNSSPISRKDIKANDRVRWFIETKHERERERAQVKRGRKRRSFVDR